MPRERAGPVAVGHLRNSFRYAAVHLETIAESARDVDQAMLLGLRHEAGHFERDGAARSREDGAGDIDADRRCNAHC